MTTDSLGIGGLLVDASRVFKMYVCGGPAVKKEIGPLLLRILSDAEASLAGWKKRHSLNNSAEERSVSVSIPW